MGNLRGLKFQLLRPNPRNQLFLDYLYRCLEKCGNVSYFGESQLEFTSVLNQNREHLSTVVKFEGKLLVFDLSDHAFLWDTGALDNCDVYFKANLNWKIAERYIGEHLSESNRQKIAPFMLFTHSLFKVNRMKWCYSLGAMMEKYDVCQITGIYRNYLLDNHGGDAFPLASSKSADEYHFWIRYLTHKYLEESGVNSFTRLTSKGQKDQEDRNSVFGTVNKHEYLRKMCASRFKFVNVMPHALYPWKATESVIMETPLILDHDTMMELPEPFLLRENEHFISLLGKRFDFDSGLDLEDPHSYRLLNLVESAEFSEAMESLIERINDAELHKYMKHQVIALKKRLIDPSNLLRYILSLVETL